MKQLFLIIISGLFVASGAFAGPPASYDLSGKIMRGIESGHRMGLERRRLRLEEQYLQMLRDSRESLSESELEEILKKVIDDHNQERMKESHRKLRQQTEDYQRQMKKSQEKLKQQVEDLEYELDRQKYQQRMKLLD